MSAPRPRLGHSASVATNVSAHRLSRRIAPADPTPPPPPPPAEPSVLEKAQAAFSATTEQMAGFRAATLAFHALAKDAERVHISRPVGRLWSDCGGDAIEEMLEHVDLIDARFLLLLNKHRGVVPRWQHVPPAAKINGGQLWRLFGWERNFSLPVLVLSYPWLDPEHPDRQGEQLAKIVPILERMLPSCGGDAFTVGVLWDYMSLPQPVRNPAEAVRFTAGLQALTTWYAHPYTHVLLVTTPLPTGTSYKSLRPYEQRGWCEAERRTCGISKCVHCLWDLSGYDPVALEGLEGMKAFDALRAQLKSGRSAPLAPDRFAALVRRRLESGELAFTAASDVDVVLEMYRAGFLRVFETYRRFDPQGFFAAWAGHDWGVAEAKQVAHALSYAAERSSKTPSTLGGISLRFEGNLFGKDGQRDIRRAVHASKHFEAVIF